MSQVTVMSIVVLVQSGDLRGAARLLYNQPIAHACDLVSKSVDLLTKAEWTALQQTLHVPATVTRLVLKGQMTAIPMNSPSAPNQEASC